MTTKNTATKPKARAQEHGPSREDLETAYRLHTLAQIVYGQLAVAHPWTVQAPVLDPAVGRGQTPWMGAGPGTWNAPVSWPR